MDLGVGVLCVLMGKILLPVGLSRWAIRKFNGDLVVIWGIDIPWAGEFVMRGVRDLEGDGSSTVSRLTKE